MLDYRPTKEEQELTITTTRAGDLADVYTNDRTYMRKLDGLCDRYPETYRRTWADNQVMGDGLPFGVRYQFPRRLLRFGRPASDVKIAAGRAAAARMNSGRRNDL